VALWVGIDGGGTRTTAVALDDTGAAIARVVGGASLVHPNHPLDGAGHLGDMVRLVLREAGSDAPARGLCCGLAGAGRAEVRDGLRAALSELGVASHVTVIGDAEAALYDAFGSGPGALVIAGTGSAAWSRNANGRSARAGGWGRLLGDEGSGYTIGLSALRAVVRAFDGRIEPTLLSTEILSTIGVAAPEHLVPWAAAASKADIAGLAPVVARAAEQGDAAATGIVEKAASDLAELVRAAVERNGPWTGAIRLALTGGLIAPGGPLRERAWTAVQTLPLRIDLLREPVDAARGAACIARAES
jgi:N-acetylglucosamine kinase-like BadF-type ATPase